MQLTPQERLIVALDVDNLKEASKLVDLLIDYVSIFKVGAQLFTAVGNDAIKMIHDKGGKVFLDLKYHDIPNTVTSAIKIAVKMEVFMLTIHTLGGKEMMTAVVEILAPLQIKPLVVGVTILTSLNQERLQEIGISTDLNDEVITLARLAKSSGLDGIVASSHEIVAIRNECGADFIIVTPGIRSAETISDDQKRVATARQAIKNGADFIVVGRPIIAAPNPANVVRQIVEEMAHKGNKTQIFTDEHK